MKLFYGSVREANSLLFTLPPPPPLLPPPTQNNHCALKDSHTNTHTRAPLHTNLRAHTSTHTKTREHANTCTYDMSDLTARIAITYVTCVRQRESVCVHLRDVRRRSQTLFVSVCMCVCSCVSGCTCTCSKRNGGDGNHFGNHVNEREVQVA